MVPWEKDVYLAMMVQAVEEENLKLQLQEAAKRASAKGPRRPRMKRG
jgi:hypothetical protein